MPFLKIISLNIYLTLYKYLVAGGVQYHKKNHTVQAQRINTIFAWIPDLVSDLKVNDRGNSKRITSTLMLYPELASVLTLIVDLKAIINFRNSGGHIFAVISYILF